MRISLFPLILIFAIPALAQPFPMPETPPNIVVILTDDLGYNDIGAYAYGDGTNPAPYTNSSYNPLPGPNRAEFLTPRTDSLATEGIRMTNYYSSNPQCSPARAALLTGSYGYRVGIPDVLQPYSKRPDRGNGFHHDELTIAELLKERGYVTGAIGKWHLGDVLQYLPTRHGFDTWFGIPFSNDMWPLNPNFGPWPDLPLWEDEATVNYTTGTGGSITSPVSTTLEQQYLLEAMTEKAIDFIDTHQSEPFFLYFSPHVPHVPCWPHPDFINDSGVSYYYDVIMELDHRVGQILDKLTALGLANDTLVIFTSDNGPWLSRHDPDNFANSAGSAYPLWGSKSEAWEGGSRVPFLARFPGQIPAGVVSDEIGEHVDLLPTLVNLADGTVPTDRTLDGGDLWPVLAQQPGAVSPDNQTFYFKSTTLYAVREGDWKYWSNFGFGASAGDLFNLSTDIQERSNVTSQPTIESDLASLRTTFWNDVNRNQRPAGTFSAQGIAVDTSALTVTEGGTATVNVSLVQSPGGTVTVTAANSSGDADLSVSAGGSLSFDSGNWSTPQAVAIAAAEDADMLDSVGVIELASPCLPSRFVYATETDNDSVPGVEPVLVWPKVTYATLQDANHGLIADGTAMINTISDPAGSTYAWSQVSGDPVTFDNPFSKSTGVAFPATGGYVLRLTTGYAGATSLTTDFQVRVDPVGATPPGGGGATETERVPYAMETPGMGSFGSGFTNYRTIVNWYERYNIAGNDSSNVTRNGREGLQDEANSSVPAAAEGAYWIILAPDSTYSDPAVYQSLGTWNAGDDTTYEVSFDLGDRDNNTFSNLVVQLVYTDAGFTPNDGTSLTTAPGYTVADSTATYTDASFSGSGNRKLTELTDTLDATGIVDGQEVWIRVTASGSGTQSLIDNLSATSLEQATINIAPVIDPGLAQSTAYSVNTITLTGSVRDDGLPDGSHLTTEWIQSGGPGTAVFADLSSPTSSVSFDYPGDYTLRLVADDGQIKAFRETTGTLLAQTLSEWAVAESIPGGQQGPGDNPDGDRWINLWEFAFGLDPNNPEYGAAPWSYTVVDATSPQTVTFRVLRARMPDISLESSPNLSQWDPTGIDPVITPVDSNPNWNEWSYSVTPDSGWERIFLRLRVSP